MFAHVFLHSAPVLRVIPTLETSDAVWSHIFFFQYYSKKCIYFQTSCMSGSWYLCNVMINVDTFFFLQVPWPNCSSSRNMWTRQQEVMIECFVVKIATGVGLTLKLTLTRFQFFCFANNVCFIHGSSSLREQLTIIEATFVNRLCKGWCGLRGGGNPDLEPYS